MDATIAPSILRFGTTGCYRPHTQLVSWYVPTSLSLYRASLHIAHLGLVKNHFYGIWIQNKILRPKHELAVLHEMLNDVSTLVSRCCAV